MRHHSQDKWDYFFFFFFIYSCSFCWLFLPLLWLSWCWLGEQRTSSEDSQQRMMKKVFFLSLKHTGKTKALVWWYKNALFSDSLHTCCADGVLNKELMQLLVNKTQQNCPWRILHRCDSPCFQPCCCETCKTSPARPANGSSLSLTATKWDVTLSWLLTSSD